MKNSINNKFIFIFYSTERIETIRLSLKVFSIEITMRTFTLSVAVILLLSIPQDGEAKPLFFGFLKKLFGGGKKNNGGGNFINLMPHDLIYIKFLYPRYFFSLFHNYNYFNLRLWSTQTLKRIRGSWGRSRRWWRIKLWSSRHWIRSTFW